MSSRRSLRSAPQMLWPRSATSCLIDGMSTPPIGAFSCHRKACMPWGGPAFKARRTDNTELDFGFSGRTMDSAALLSWCAGASAFVTTWYDQSGNGNHLTQTVTTKQPRIVNAGTLELISTGIAGMRFDGTNDFLERADTFGLLGSPAITTAWTYLQASGDTYLVSIGGGASNSSWLISPNHDGAILYVGQGSSYRAFTWPSKTVAAQFIAGKAAGATPSSYYLERESTALTQSAISGGATAQNITNNGTKVGINADGATAPTPMQFTSLFLFNADLTGSGAERTALRAELSLHK